MSSKLKRLGAGLVAVLALSLVASASAPAAQFTAPKYPTSYEVTGGEGIGSITTPSGSIKCKKYTASGTISEASSTITVSSTASECTAFGFASAHVIANGCYSVIHVKEGSGDTYKGTGDLVCPAGKEVVLTPTAFGASVCSDKIPPQTGNSQIEFTNNTLNKTVEGKVLSQVVHYTSTGGSCGSAGEHTDAKVQENTPTIVGGKEKLAVID